ncbi:hypothetical protein AVEN_170242-1 [Araneus ventricosus]|uniref:Uncharacterized protein n=1 Tax=Araneus ventricosus TaxID=182803 RepID=A0A4Y2GD07_ARAVE|nr:hypothetical protein AVEN_10818-1 [Araneus ventricosus]GBM50612.1 hypothetical protein AVEN_39170-1 [Araneus ventricosus]GBM50697.1 hypothetical protein AVEN_93012-1 [Araneus ventricosus]GBM50786.1 hypothetical protein AVEN_170242-1 [Araneus ventricosus]
MSAKRNILLLVTLVAILGCGNAASRHHARSRAYSDSLKNDELEREFELIESGDDENNGENGFKTSFSTVFVSKSETTICDLTYLVSGWT